MILSIVLKETCYIPAMLLFFMCSCPHNYIHTHIYSCSVIILVFLTQPSCPVTSLLLHGGDITWLTLAPCKMWLRTCSVPLGMCTWIIHHRRAGKTACDSFKEKERLFRKYLAKCHSNIAQLQTKNTMSWCLSFTHCCPKGARLLRAWHNVQAANLVQGISILVSL